jgi:hypothetical protein
VNDRDQLVAVRLLLRWRELFDKVTDGDLTNADELLEIGVRLRALRAQTDLFIDHHPVPADGKAGRN